MTRSEAIKQLRLLKGDITFGIASKVENKNQIEALSIAIASLETDEAYQLEYESTTKNDLGVSSGLKNESPIIDWNNCHTSEQLDSIATPKKDLGVDAVSRKAVLDLIADYDLSMGQVVKGIHALPSVTPQPRKGHWTEEFNDLEGEVRFTCSSCGKYQLFGTDFCYHCGSDNREVE